MISNEGVAPAHARRQCVLPMSRSAERQPATTCERQLIARLHTAGKTITAYPPGHPATVSLAHSAWSDVMAACGEEGSVELSVVGRELRINGHSVGRGDRNATGLLDVLFERDIRTITLGSEVEEDSVAQLLSLLSRPVEELDAEGGIEAAIEARDLPGLAVRTVRYERPLVEGDSSGGQQASLAAMAAPLLKRSLAALGYVDADSVLRVIEEPREVLRVAVAGDEGATEARQLLRASRHLVAAILSLADSDDAVAGQLAEVVGRTDPRLAELVTARLGLSSALQAAEALAPGQIAEMIQRSAQAGLFDAGALEQQLEDLATAAMLVARENQSGVIDESDELRASWERLDARAVLSQEMTDGGADPLSQARMVVELLHHERDPERYRDLSTVAVDIVRRMITAREYEIADEVLEALRRQAGRERPLGGLVAELATRAIGSICTRQTAEFLLNELTVSRVSREKEALRGLMERLGQPALQVLAQVVMAGHPPSALADAAEMLLQMPEAEAEELAVRGLKRGPRESRLELMQAAGHLGGDRAVRLLMTALAEDRPQERQEALLLLGRLRAEDVVPVAGRIGRDTGWLDRPRRGGGGGGGGGGGVGTPEAIDELEDLVSIRAPLAPWRSARVQRAAFEAICGLEAPAAEKALERISARGPRWLRGVARRLVAGGMGHDRRGAAVELTAEGAETTP
jgi:hypothetical protein